MLDSGRLRKSRLFDILTDLFVNMFSLYQQDSCVGRGDRVYQVRVYKDGVYEDGVYQERVYQDGVYLDHVVPWDGVYLEVAVRRVS
jgi:hypothetical protein